MPGPRRAATSSSSSTPRRRVRADSLAVNLRHYAKYLVASELDAAVTVAAADRALAGSALGTLNARDPGFEAAFAQLLAAVPPGTEDTSCLEQALRLFEAAPSFRRPGVPTAVVCITDGADDAVSPWQVLVGRFASRTEVPVVSVVGPFVHVPGCTVELDDGRLASLTQTMGGVREELCTPDWARALENLTRHPFGIHFEALLSQPALRIVEVTVDGTRVPAIDPRGAGAWRWDAARNAIVFSPIYAPEPGAVVRVTYEPSCP